MLLKTLAETGHEQDTLVIFVADHGEFLGNHGLLLKPSMHFDEILRVPMIMRVPWCERARGRIRGLVELTDVHPTLLGLLGLQVNPGVQGTDWSGSIAAGEPFGREDIYADMHHMPHGPYMAVYTLRTEAWKLNIFPTAGREFGQLFDLRQDPGETCNLYANPAYHGQREELLWRLLQRIHANIDPLPLLLSQW